MRSAHFPWTLRSALRRKGCEIDCRNHKIRYVPLCLAASILMGWRFDAVVSEPWSLPVCRPIRSSVCDDKACGVTRGEGCACVGGRGRTRKCEYYRSGGRDIATVSAKDAKNYASPYLARWRLRPSAKPTLIFSDSRPHENKRRYATHESSSDSCIALPSSSSPNSGSFTTSASLSLSLSLSSTSMGEAEFLPLPLSAGGDDPGSTLVLPLACDDRGSKESAIYYRR